MARSTQSSQGSTVPAVNQAADQIISVPSHRQAVASQILDLSGNVIGTRDRPLFVTSSAWQQRGRGLTPLSQAAVDDEPVLVTSPTEDQQLLAWEGLIPVLFRKEEGDQPRWGLDAEAIEQKAPDLTRDIGGHKYYDLAGVLSVAIAEIKHQQQLIGQLQERLNSITPKP